MKYGLFVFLALAVIATSSATLKEDFKDFAPLYPTEAFRKLYQKHSTLDNEFMQFQKFLHTQDFAKVWTIFISNPKSRAILQYLQETGIDVHYELSKFAEYYKLPEYQGAENVIMPRTVISYVDEIVKALPKDAWTALMKEKMNTSPEFKRMHDRLLSAEFHELLQQAKVEPTLAAPLRLLESKGLKFNKVVQAVEKVLSWVD